MGTPSFAMASLLALLLATTAHAACPDSGQPCSSTTASAEPPRLMLSAEVRVRQVAVENAQLRPGNDLDQRQLRVLLGADLRIDPHLRVFGEVATGQVDRRRGTAPASFQNALSLQQLHVDVGGKLGSASLGAIVGRQAFADGPRQLLSVGDGPNLQRTWNGIRLQARGPGFRIGAFDLRATRLGSAGMDEAIDPAETLRGISAGIRLSQADAPEVWLDPFWIRSEQPAYRSVLGVGPDARDTLGARLWRQHGKLRFDWTLAGQSGRHRGHRANAAWALFAVQSLALSEAGWKPRLTSRVDIASGGGVSEGHGLRTFNPLYASSGYLGEGQFLALSNLVMLTPGISFAPSPATGLALEYGLARRFDDHDAVYAGGGRIHAGTTQVPGHAIGRLARLSGSWTPHDRFSLRLDLEHFSPGRALQAAGLTSGGYAYLDATFRY